MDRLNARELDQDLAHIGVTDIKWKVVNKNFLIICLENVGPSRRLKKREAVVILSNLEQFKQFPLDLLACGHRYWDVNMLKDHAKTT